MNAAVLHSFGSAPRFEPFAEPTVGEGEVLLHVLAAALHPSTRAVASGSHYSSPRELPTICGLDACGRLEDGTRLFFGGPRPPYGTMAQRCVVPRARCLPVPDGLDDATAAAIPNPALSSWLPLVHSAHLAPGETVLILGATGRLSRCAPRYSAAPGSPFPAAASHLRTCFSGFTSSSWPERRAASFTSRPNAYRSLMWKRPGSATTCTAAGW